jgi:hypothetical protein
VRAGAWQWDAHHGWARLGVGEWSAVLVYAQRGDWLGTDYGAIQVGPFRNDEEAKRALDAALRAAGWVLD